MLRRERFVWAAIGAGLMLAVMAGCIALFMVWPGRARVTGYLGRHLPQLESTATFEAQGMAQTEETQEPVGPIARALLPLVRKQQTPTPTPSAEPSVQAEATKTPKATRKPKPSPTPTLAWPEPLAEPGPSKLGLHVQWNNSPEIMEYVRRIKPPVVKTVGDFGFLADLKEASPSTIVIGRFQGQDEGYAFPMQGDPAAAAEAFVAQRLEQYQQNPLVDYWEGLNEPGVQDTMAWYAAFEKRRVEVMAEHGLRCAVGAFSAGVPEWEAIEAFLPAVEAAKAHGGILTLHEYDAPTLNRSVGAGLPGRPNYPDRGALALRYRWWYEDWLEPRGLVIPLVISEAGVDGLISGRPGPKGKGWRNFASYWEQEGLGGDPIKTYMDQLAWYDSELRKDDYVLGCAIFTAGAMGDDWDSYDITDILRQLAHYAVKLK